MKYHVQSVRNQANHALETLEMIEKVEWPQNVEKMAWPRTTLRCSFWSFEFSTTKKGCCQFTSATVLVPSHHTKIIRAKIQRIGTQESIRFCPGIIDRLLSVMATVYADDNFDMLVTVFQHWKSPAKWFSHQNLKTVTIMKSSTSQLTG